MLTINKGGVNGIGRILYSTTPKNSIKTSSSITKPIADSEPMSKSWLNLLVSTNFSQMA